MKLYRVTSLVSHGVSFPITSNGKVQEVYIDNKGSSVNTEELNHRLKVLERTGTITITKLKSATRIKTPSISERESQVKSLVIEPKPKEESKPTKEDPKNDKDNGKELDEKSDSKATKSTNKQKPKKGKK